METIIKSDLLRRERTIAPLAYSIKDAAATLGVGRTTLYRFIREGEIEVVKVGSRTLITTEGLEAFLEREATRRGDQGRWVSQGLSGLVPTRTNGWPRRPGQTETKVHDQDKNNLKEEEKGL